MAKLREAKSAYSKQLNRHNPLPLNINAWWLNNQLPVKIPLFIRDDLPPNQLSITNKLRRAQLWIRPLVHLPIAPIQTFLLFSCSIGRHSEPASSGPCADEKDTVCYGNCSSGTVGSDRVLGLTEGRKRSLMKRGGLTWKDFCFESLWGHTRYECLHSRRGNG